jgi:hypothetical protein
MPALPGTAANVTRSMKNPRGPITLKRMSNGLYLLLWFFNSVPSFTMDAATSRTSRNPYWLSAGREAGDGTLEFTQPEVVLYVNGSDALNGRIGYPDFIQDVDNSIWVTEARGADWGSACCGRRTGRVVRWHLLSHVAARHVFLAADGQGDSAGPSAPGRFFAEAVWAVHGGGGGHVRD